MLVAAFVWGEQPYPTVEIIKFVDRIWLNELGNASYWRAVTVRVAKESPAPLKAIVMVLACGRDQMTPPEDISDTLLLQPEEYYFNSTKRHGFSVVEKTAQGGIINDDGIDGVQVQLGNRVYDVAIADESVIRVEFAQAVEPGATLAFRIQFGVNRLAEERIRGSLELTLPYFDSWRGGRNYTEAVDWLGPRQQIPALLQIDQQFRGGFDVFVYGPKGMESHEFLEAERSLDNRLPNGEQSGYNRAKLKLHLRQLVRKDRVVLGDGKQFTGRFAPPLEDTIKAGTGEVIARVTEASGALIEQIDRVSGSVQHLEKQTGVVATRLARANRVSILGLAAGLAALVASIIALIATLA